MDANVDTIRTKVSSDPRWAQRAILALYERQTIDEQNSGFTVYKNGMGFSGYDAEILTSFAKQIGNGRTLTTKQLAVAYRRLPRYAKQLALVAEERQAA